MKRIRFKPHLVAEVLEGEGLLLLSEKNHVALPGAIYELVAAHIDGRHSKAEIVDLLKSKAPTEEVEKALNHLEQLGLLAEAEDTISDPEAAFWWVHDIDPKIALQRFKENAVSLDCFGNIEADGFAKMLETLHVRLQQNTNFGVVVTDDYLCRELSEYNKQSLNTDRFWMLIKPVGSEIWIGPVFVPGQTACWECLAYRLRMNRNAESLVRYKKYAGESFSISRAFTDATLNIAWNEAATIVARWIADPEFFVLQNQMLTHDLISGTTRTHTVVWRPQCPVCGDPVETILQDTPPITLRSQKKKFTLDGGHRVTSPETTVEKYQHHISPITGLVKTLERQASSSAALYVYGAGVNCVIARDGFKGIADAMASSGKGASDLQARASGLCESLERYSGIFHGDEPRKKGRLKDLGDAAIHPYKCFHYSDKQYENRKIWNAKQTSQLFVPNRFDEDAEIEWSPVWSLTRNEIRYVPTMFCYYNYPARDQDIFCRADSNGNAAGNTLEEAILQGFLELVERDSVALWWFNRIRRPIVNWESFDLPYLEEVRQYHEELHRELWVLDITSDLQIPAFVALSRRTDGPEERIILGYGAHLDAKIGILRAVTEVNQALVWTSEIFNKDGKKPASRKYYDSFDFDIGFSSLRRQDQPYMSADANTPARTVKDYPHLWSDDLKEDILISKSIIEELGLEMLVLDQTRADVGMPVVKVIVPGLRHFWPRYGPGRLYDVPVKLGWLSEPRTEEQLNPVLIVS